MKGKIKPQDQIELFKSRLDNMIDIEHQLCVLAREIDWNWIDQEFSDLYADQGRPSVPVRTMVGMLLLKHLYDQSDESVLARWVENPYWQYFTGETHFQHKPPFNPTDFVHFRKRVGEKGMEKILSLTVRLHYGSATEPEIVIDTTVQEKNITYPTDDKLAWKIIRYCWSYADAEGITLRQSYRFVAKSLRLKLHNGHHPKRRKAADKARKKLKTIAGRLVRDLERKMDQHALSWYGESLDLFKHVLAQEVGDKDKRYSLHEPDVWCIAKGKAHKKYEFGCKVSVARTALSGVIVGMKSFKENPYDGDTLQDSLEQVERVRVDAFGDRPALAVADRGYRGRKQIGETQVLCPGRSKASDTQYQKRKQRERFRRRAGIEPIISHLKYDHRMWRNFLAGAHGDMVNCIMAGSAFNLKKRLNQIKTALHALFGWFRAALFNIWKVLEAKIDPTGNVHRTYKLHIQNPQIYSLI